MDAISAAHDGEIQMIDSTSIRAHQQAATEGGSLLTHVHDQIKRLVFRTRGDVPCAQLQKPCLHAPPYLLVYFLEAGF